MKRLACLSLLAACATAGDPDDADFSPLCFGKCDGISLTDHAGPEMLTFDELVQLSPLVGARNGAHYDIAGAPQALVDKVNRLLDTPFLSNEAFKSGSRPRRPQHAGLGTTIDVAQWNIERGQQLPGILDAFRTSPDLSTVDVVILNEVDRYMKRSGYADVIAELGKTLDMNWTWGAEFIEVDPTHLGTEQFAREDFLDVDANTGATLDNGRIPEADLAAHAAEANQMMAVDSSRSRNLHGNAILSRYPILSTRAIPLDTVCWDWNAGERERKQWIQQGKDYLAEKVFLEKMDRQIRHGGRTVLIADLYVPGLSAQGTSMEAVPGVRPDVVTVVTAHLEAKSTPECRARQMAEVLTKLADIKNPVVFGGDLNTFGGDGRPTTVERILKAKITDWQWISKQAVTRFAPYSGWVFTSLSVVNWVRLKDDPTGINIPLLLPNPERGLFDAVENFAFADGGRFDFRGDSSRTVNGTGKTLANSNQRDTKGFKTTSSLERTLGVGDLTFVGKWKIDWMFVRGYARSPRDGKASYRMAPHLARTLEDLQFSTTPRLADHAPITVVLPLHDECHDGACSGDAATDLEFGDVTWDDANEF